MSSLREIERAIDGLDPHELAELHAWLDRQRSATSTQRCGSTRLRRTPSPRHSAPRPVTTSRVVLDTDILSEDLKGHDKVIAGHAEDYARQHAIYHNALQRRAFPARSARMGVPPDARSGSRSARLRGRKHTGSAGTPADRMNIILDETIPQKP